MTDIRIIIVGAGDLGRELACWIINSDPGIIKDKNIYFIDDTLEGNIFAANLSIPILSDVDKFIPKLDDVIYLAISSPVQRKKIAGICHIKGIKFSSFKHPKSLIASSVDFGEGCLFFPFSVCSENAYIGDFVIVNLFSSIGHDVKLGSFCTLSSHVDLTGYVMVEEGVTFGSGSRVLPSLKIGERCTIGAGAIICKSVPSKNTAYALPAKLIK